MLRFVFTTLMGGCMGSLGTAIAEVSEYQPWADVLSGALGASGAFGLELIIRRLLA